MIPIARVPEPKSFDTKVRKPGRKWSKVNPKAARPKPLWEYCIQPLRDGFGDLCGYAAMLDATGGTVDHYLSYKNHPQLAYEWSNYRFASAALNASKKNADNSVLDPYEVGAGWFEILLPSLQMRTTNVVPAELREKAEFTLRRLNLRDGERIVRWRQKWHAMYVSGKLSLDGLRTVAPLIADAVERASTTSDNPRR